MALTFSAATLKSAPGQGDQIWSFFIVLDGTLLTQTAMALPTNFPNFASTTGPAAGNSNAATSAAKRVIYLAGAGGTSPVVSLTRVLPTAAAPSTQIDVFVNAAGTNAHTVEVLAIVKDQAF